MLSGGRGNNVEESQRGTLGIQKDRQKEEEEEDRDLRRERRAGEKNGDLRSQLMEEEKNIACVAFFSDSLSKSEDKRQSGRKKGLFRLLEILNALSKRTGEVFFNTG